MVTCEFQYLVLPHEDNRTDNTAERILSGYQLPLSVTLHSVTTVPVTLSQQQH